MKMAVKQFSYTENMLFAAEYGNFLWKNKIKLMKS